MRPYQFMHKLGRSDVSVADELLSEFHESSSFNKHNIAAQSFKSFFHLNDPRQVAINAQGYKRYPTFSAVPLLAPAARSVSLNHVLRKRRSERNFCSENFVPQDLANILGMSLRRQRQLKLNSGNTTAYLGSYPSGGGLFPVETYCLPVAVAGLDFGGYYYNAVDHHLIPISHPKIEDLSVALNYQQADLQKLMCVLVQAAVLPRTTAKYGNRGYRFALLEAGHAAQNILLSCAAYKYSALPWGGALDEPLARLLMLDAVAEVVVNTIFIGRAS